MAHSDVPKAQSAGWPTTQCLAPAAPGLSAFLGGFCRIFIYCIPYTPVSSQLTHTPSFQYAALLHTGVCSWEVSEIAPRLSFYGERKKKKKDSQDDRNHFVTHFLIVEMDLILSTPLLGHPA